MYILIITSPLQIQLTLIVLPVVGHTNLQVKFTMVSNPVESTQVSDSGSD